MGRGQPTVRQWPILWVGVYPQRVEGYLSESANGAVNKKTPFPCMTAPTVHIWPGTLFKPGTKTGISRHVKY